MWVFYETHIFINHKFLNIMGVNGIDRVWS